MQRARLLVLMLVRVLELPPTLPLTRLRCWERLNRNPPLLLHPLQLWAHWLAGLPHSLRCYRATASHGTSLSNTNTKLITRWVSLPSRCALLPAAASLAFSQIIGRDEFAFDESWLHGQIEPMLEYWLGERGADVVSAGESWKCRWCNYHAECDRSPLSKQERAEHDRRTQAQAQAQSQAALQSQQPSSHVVEHKATAAGASVGSATAASAGASAAPAAPALGAGSGAIVESSPTAPASTASAFSRSDIDCPDEAALLALFSELDPPDSSDGDTAMAPAAPSLPASSIGSAGQAGAGAV